MKDFAVGTIPGPDGSPIGSRGGPPERFWDLRSGRKVIKIDEFRVFSWGN